MNTLERIFGNNTKKELRKIRPIVRKVMSLEEEYKKLTDAELKAKTPELRERLKNGATLDEILPEAFAAIREADYRVLGMRPYEVQVIGGIILHQGRIAEMKTGEGKTLVATLPAYLNGLSGEGVHIVTVNDYLAKRDSEWMGKVYRFMGLTVGLVIHATEGREARQAAYRADITYGTNNEFGFDYLRDNMCIYKEEQVQRGHVFAIVDEVDSILIDEARTPLIISGQGDESTELYNIVDKFVCGLKGLTVAKVDSKEEEDPNIDADYVVNEKEKTATLTLRGIAKAEKYFNIENLADLEHTTLAHHINQAIKAHGVMHRDIDYVVRDGEVVIVDEFTGRLMFGRRFNEGLHQALEAKEHVQVARENKTLATITFQNYFRMYDKLSGMTGTAMTEREEFGTIYELDIIEIPTNKPVIRVDHPDMVFKTEAGKFRAIVRQVKECHEKGQPVLVGTVSIEKSQRVAEMLKKEGIVPQVLNAKYHEKEAEIIAQAGTFGAVTVATNMAGRGTDIMLGGNAEYLAKRDLKKAGLSDELIAEATGYADTDDEAILNARKMFQESEAKYKADIEVQAEKVKEVGGLFIIGTERHESRRIDNQLRGRSGRQGDPGESRFYVSMEDDIMRLFGTERAQNMMDTFGVDEDTPINSKMLTKAIENAQVSIESKNFQARKQVLDYDDVMNIQRETIYAERQKVLEGEDLEQSIKHMIHTVIERSIRGHQGEQRHMSAEDLDAALKPWRGVFLQPGEFHYTDEELMDIRTEDLIDKVYTKALYIYEKKEKLLGEDSMRKLERVMLLRVVDEYWMDNIDNMEELKRGIMLRAYAQVNPVVAYKKEGYEMFEEMIANVQEETVRRIYIARIARGQEIRRERVAKETGASGADDGSVSSKPKPVHRVKKPGPNDPCPCGSGLKFKKCTCQQYHPNLPQYQNRSQD